MLKKYLLILITLSFFLNVFSQKSINDYKYVVVPLKYNFVKGEDKFRINTLTRHLFKENGFIAFFDKEELPEDLFQNRCLALYADVEKLDSGLSTKMKISLKDCKNEMIFNSSIGKTKIKDYSKAYPIAIREAFLSIELLNYKYNPTNTSQNEIIEVKDNKEQDTRDEANLEVKRLKKELEDLKKLKDNKEQDLDKVEKVEKELKIEKTPEVIVEETKPEPQNKVKYTDDLQILYAKVIVDGFQLFNTDSSMMMMLLKTSAQNVFIVKDKNAIVYKHNDKWMYSENNGVNKNEKELNIKF